MAGDKTLGNSNRKGAKEVRDLDLPWVAGVMDEPLFRSFDPEGANRCRVADILDAGTREDAAWIYSWNGGPIRSDRRQIPDRCWR
ncbi:hypothetical protein KM043_008348 [Ampulex compressa]|nr:hypothetical protein KM043_008348 [Ampulex compressa]